MESSYSLTGDLMNVGGNPVDKILKDTIGAHYMIAAAVIIVLVVVLLFMLFKKENFSPATLARNQVVSLSGSEAMDSTGSSTNTVAAFNTAASASAQNSRADSYFAQEMQDAPVGALDCTNAGTPVDDAWGWMNNVAYGGSASTSTAASGSTSTTEGLGNKTDMQLTAIMAGH